MALVIDGNGTLTGLTNAAIPASKIGTGAVLQAASNTYGTQTSSTSQSYITLMTIIITPTSSSSKFLLLANLSASGRGVFNFFRGATQIHSHSADPYVMWGYNQSDWNNNSMRAPFTVTALDSPGTTSPVTYTVQMRSRGGTSTDAIGINEVTSGSTFSNFIVLEIA